MPLFPFRPTVRTKKNSISGARAGKGNLALAQCFVSLKSDCSKDKKIITSACLKFLEIGEERLEGSFVAYVLCVLCIGEHTMTN